ncbi:GNAT family N-acetyltransferase [Streptomyces sp. NPDC005805]|uniref:GNAT family N-acetyltransferase n=1 Tax=Streptomyces sp. NPDC005805 TaxID=3157068 RepID=UPI0033DD026C
MDRSTTMPHPHPHPEPARLAVRPAVDEDLPALQALARRTIDASYRSFLGDESVDWFIGSGASDEHIATHLRQGQVHCMQADGEIVGLTILDGPTLDLMMVDAGRHRQGLGRFLLGRAEELLFARHEDIRLETFAGNTRAIAFYEACGWRESGPLESGDGMPARAEFVKRRPAR